MISEPILEYLGGNMWYFLLNWLSFYTVTPWTHIGALSTIQFMSV